MNELIENAKIDSTMLGIEDHGCMTFMIYLGFDGASQGFGGYNMNGETGAIKGMKDIRKLLEVVGVSKWEDLKGELVRIEKEGPMGKILRLGNIIENKWFKF